VRQGLRLDWRAVGWQGWWAVFYMALGTSVLAYLLWFWALRHLAASRLSVFTYLQPVLGTLLGIYVLHEAFTLQLAAAGGLVLGGVLLTEWHPRRLADDEDESVEAVA
jgi:drug/metabolite transporter (DMT)-like permease